MTYRTTLISEVLDFLLLLFRANNYSYSTMNTLRSALSTIIRIDDKPVGQHPLVVRFMKACYNERPALPKNKITWDTDKMLVYLKSLSPSKKLSLESLTKKVTMLLLLLSGQRGQSIHLLDIRNMTLTKSSVTFRIGDPLKQTRPGKHIGEIAVKAYAPDRRLCLITALSSYIDLTKNLRGNETRLLLTHRKPYKGASIDTIRRWVRQTLLAAGIDLAIFSPHSTRAASSSKVATKLPIATILTTAGWSRESTFAKYYNKKVDDKFDFGQAILT